jgi:LCP family protein required for cell wall assembly
MVSGRPPDGAADPPPRRRRRRSSNEDGLRALGSQMEGSDRGDVANEEKLRALGSKVEGTDEGPVANEEGLRALGQRVDEAADVPRTKGGKKRWSTRRKILTPVIALLLLALILVIGAYGYARYRYDQIHKVAIASEHQEVTGQPFNVLVIGSDSRVGDKSGTKRYGTATLVGGQRSDVIMVWHIVPSTRQITILSIPRDTLVSMVGKNVTTFGKFNRINSSYNKGPTLLVQTIQNNFGIPINHVVQVDFAGFKGSVNALGGVYLDFKYPARDSFSGLNITTPGCQLLAGTQALAVARSRHYQYYATTQWQTDPTGDFGRIKRQDAFLKALVDAAKSKYNPLTINAFLGSLPQGITIDTHLSLGDLIGLAEDFHSINPTGIKTVTIPTFSNGYVTPWGDVLFVQQPAAQQLFVSVFGSALTNPSSPPPSTRLVPNPPPDLSAGGAATGSGSSTSTSTSTSTAATSATSSTAAPSTTTTTQPPTPSFDPVPCKPN